MLSALGCACNSRRTIEADRPKRVASLRYDASRQRVRLHAASAVRRGVASRCQGHTRAVRSASSRRAGRSSLAAARREPPACCGARRAVSGQGRVPAGHPASSARPDAPRQATFRRQSLRRREGARRRPRHRHRRALVAAALRGRRTRCAARRAPLSAGSHASCAYSHPCTAVSRGHAGGRDARAAAAHALLGILQGQGRLRDCDDSPGQ